MLARVPWTPKPAKVKAAPRRLKHDRQRLITDRIAEIMREAEPTPFSVEGPCRAGLRARLCLQGWPWKEADKVADEIVRGALNIVGAKRPTWEQGQPEWTQPGALPVPRERCARCNRLLPDGHRLWCSDVCARAAKMDRQRQRWDEESYAAWKANKAAWVARQPDRPCGACGLMFKPKRTEQRFCRYECTVIDRRGSNAARRSS